MDTVFSQIPHIVLNKIDPQELYKYDIDIEENDFEEFQGIKEFKEAEGLKKLEEHKEPEGFKEPKSRIKKTVKFSDDMPDEVTNSTCSTLDAIIQTDAKPALVDRGTQTTEPYPTISQFYDRDQLKSQVESLSLCGYKPMYSTSKRKGKEPPLKIGLTLPKGKKRKVYYPDYDD